MMLSYTPPKKPTSQKILEFNPEISEERSIHSLLEHVNYINAIREQLKDCDANLKKVLVERGLTIAEAIISAPVTLQLLYKPYSITNNKLLPSAGPHENSFANKSQAYRGTNPLFLMQRAIELGKSETITRAARICMEVYSKQEAIASLSKNPGELGLFPYSNWQDLEHAFQFYVTLHHHYSANENFSSLLQEAQDVLKKVAGGIFTHPFYYGEVFGPTIDNICQKITEQNRNVQNSVDIAVAVAIAVEGAVVTLAGMQARYPQDTRPFTAMKDILSCRSGHMVLQSTADKRFWLNDRESTVENNDHSVLSWVFGNAKQTDANNLVAGAREEVLRNLQAIALRMTQEGSPPRQELCT